MISNVHDFPDLRNAVEVGIVATIEAGVAPTRVARDVADALVARIDCGDLPAGFPAGQTAAWGRDFVATVWFNMASQWAADALNDLPIAYELAAAVAAGTAGAA